MKTLRKLSVYLQVTALLLASWSGAARAQDVTLAPATGGSFRFKDIGGQAFSSTFISNFSYSNASVTVTLSDTTDLFLSGKIKATGLKPNFAYQLKLASRSTKAAQTPEELALLDDVTNERLGRQGRWWRYAPNPGNAKDADYDADKDKEGHIYGGYMIVGFFITDANGAIDTTFEGSNSLHVLWRNDQRPPSPNDGPLKTVTLPDTSGNTAYDTTLAARTLDVYGEHEPTRALPGKLAMPLGHYRCEFNLTEESFHDGGLLGGQWATAMASQVEFNIPTSSSESTTQPLQIDYVRATMLAHQSGHDTATVMGSLILPANIALENQEVRINLLGTSQTVTLNAKGICNTRDVQLIVRPSLTDATVAHFVLRLRRAAFVLGQLNGVPSPQPFDVDLTLTLGGQYYAGKFASRLRAGGSRISLTK
jgi:hypothetical protein